MIQNGLERAKADDTYWNRFFDTDLFAYKGERISHYTGLQGLYGIMESGGFWLSDHRFLNDSEEFENGRKLTQSILERLMKKRRYAAFRPILEATLNKIVNYSDKAYYVCSFSLDADNLDQWRAYAQDGQGISITFDNSAHLEDPFFVKPITSVSKVIYDDRKKSRIIIRILRKYAIEFLYDLRHSHEINYELWASEISEKLVLRFMHFKNSAFASENEARMIVSTSKLKDFKRIRHRVRCDRIIPYIESSDLSEQASQSLPILQICVGPTANQELAYRSIKTYLKNIGYERVEVIKSMIPYRK
jgi:hypothetical protein